MMDRAACLYLSLRRARSCGSTREETMVNNKEERVILLRRRDRKMISRVDLRAGGEDVWIRLMKEAAGTTSSEGPGGTHMVET